MYDRLLKLLEAEGKQKTKQPELIAKRPGTMQGGVGSGKKPKEVPYTPNVVIRDGKYVTLNQPSTGDPGSIKSQRVSTRGAAAPDIHAGRRRPRRSDNQG